jgi:hypothetical protein
MKSLKRKFINMLQNTFWIRLKLNYIINDLSDVTKVDPRIQCEFVRIRPENCHRVKDFREEDRISQYRDKLAHEEIGYFVEYEGKTIASIWATINKTQKPRIVRGYMTLLPNESLIHDIVTGEDFRGLSVGPFMVSRIIPILKEEYGVSRIIIDVSVRNHPSRQMMKKAGLHRDHQMLYITFFSKLHLQWQLKKYV